MNRNNYVENLVNFINNMIIELEINDNDKINENTIEFLDLSYENDYLYYLYLDKLTNKNKNIYYNIIQNIFCNYNILIRITEYECFNCIKYDNTENLYLSLIELFNSDRLIDNIIKTNNNSIKLFDLKFVD